MSDKLILCQHCIHREVCGNEGVDDPALTFCADYLPISGWISVKDRLPEDFEAVLVVVDGVVREANYHDNAFSGSNFWRSSARIKWWMSMPELPKMPEEDK